MPPLGGGTHRRTGGGQRKNPTDTRYMKSSWPPPRACVPAGGALWGRFLAILWPGGAKPAEVGPLVSNKAAPSAARYRPGEGNRRWERPHSPRHSPAHPQRQCSCPLARALLQFIPGRLANLGWDSWFSPEPGVIIPVPCLPWTCRPHRWYFLLAPRVDCRSATKDQDAQPHCGKTGSVAWRRRPTGITGRGE